MHALHLLLLCLVGAADGAACRDKQQVSLTVGGQTGITAAQLADRIACDGGKFDVRWTGAIVKRPIQVGEKTMVSITGVGPAGASVVNGDRRGGLFVVRPHAELRLAHLELTGARYGGCIRAAPNSKVRVVDCTLSNSTAQYGGAIDTDGELHCIRSAFSDNKIVHNLQLAGNGGAINGNEGSSVSVTGCNFTGSSTPVQGGAIAAESRLTISSSNFNGNSAFQGGSVKAGSTSSVVVQDCTFSDEKAASDGGAIFSAGGTVTCHSSRFMRNKAAKENAGTLAATNTARMIITSSVLAYSVAQGAGSLGGILYGGDDAQVTLTGVTLANSSAASGGALAVDGMLRCSNSAFTGTSAYDSGGSIYGGINSALALDGVTINNSTAVINGGAVSAQGTLIIKASVCSDVSECRLRRSQECHNALRQIHVSRCGKHSPILVNGSLGGILYAADDAQVTLTGVTLANSSARSEGALAVDGMLRCSNSTFTGTSGEEKSRSTIIVLMLHENKFVCANTPYLNTPHLSIYGGSNSALALDNVTINNSTAVVNGGAISAQGTLIMKASVCSDVSECRLRRSQECHDALRQIHVSRCGKHSPILVNGSAEDVLISASTFHDNTATGGAGGAVLQEGEVLSVVVATGLDDVEFSGNSAQCCFARNYTVTLEASCVDVSAGYSTDW
ncbi:hypothetical protein JKP88DRAFT_247302 [Tribonema minus]|uniref:Uncharacterized protein n=1 Tax=Tribonema minus TaxID=303371 RepID=A0A836CBD5_9STRA|nr:hypothetical protein JKP88DRAFT_247302 [Tribonema minus]